MLVHKGLKFFLSPSIRELGLGNGTGHVEFGLCLSAKSGLRVTGWKSWYYYQKQAVVFI